ncbi:cytochrome P450 [Ganoderma sinense ZZ0214-1]|uniref:Cytochrome P450 n=1 Tax=Ganoderma sinense ZZ0214-1 TaxID=1077348 RepID=A0A2G8S3F2_9APHY|nr:cytochrome P450 [Ganoderma sinense ZZ0214-1]
MLSPSSDSAAVVAALSISALLAHQIFRKYETSSLPVHAFLLLVPPAIASHHVKSAGAGWPTISELVFCYTTYLGVLAVSVVLYRLSPFHPLHQYPGPIWCRTSMLWHVMQTINGKQMEYLRSLHDTYGDVVRVGPNHLSVRDPSLIGPILGPAGISKCLQVPLVYPPRRRAWNRGLAPSALKGYDHIMSNRVHQLVEVLGQQEGAVVLGKWINYFAYDFMSDMVFGGGSEQMRDGDKGDIWAMVDKGAEIGFHLGQIPWLGIYLGYIPGAGGPLNLLLEHGRQQTKKRIARGSSTRDLFYYLNNEDLPGEAPPPERHLLDDGVLAMVAGSDTTSSAITSVFHCLLAHPPAYAALQDEVDRFYPRGEDVCDVTHHREMRYLTAVINETLRLFPPAPTSSPRQVPHDAPAPVVVGARSLVLAPGTHVYVPPYVLHRDARNFVFPDAFWPERWLVAAGRMPLALARARAPSLSLPRPSGSTSTAMYAADLEAEFAHDERASVPFSHGPANCVGRALAMRQMRVVVCAVLQRFRAVRPGDEERWEVGRYEREFRDYLVANRPELGVVLEKRW